MRRLAENQLFRWKDSSRRKPLIIRGARQVGKSWLVVNKLAEQFVAQELIFMPLYTTPRLGDRSGIA